MANIAIVIIKNDNDMRKWILGHTDVKLCDSWLCGQGYFFVKSLHLSEAVCLWSSDHQVVYCLGLFNCWGFCFNTVVSLHCNTVTCFKVWICTIKSNLIMRATDKETDDQAHNFPGRTKTSVFVPYQYKQWSHLCHPYKNCLALPL